MNETVKIIKIGNSAGVILPKSDLERLRVGIGDVVSKVSTADSIQFKPVDSEFEEQMAAAREVMARRYQALRELAK